jgi:hypothetical protein
MIRVTADVLVFSAKPQPQALQRGAREGPHLKALTKAHQGRQLQGKQPLGNAITEAKAKAHQQWHLPPEAWLGWRSC